RTNLVRLDGLRSLHRRPAIVAALLDAVNRLPQLPADVADEQLSGLAIEAHAPGVAKAVSPHLWPRSLHADEGVVFRHGVVLGAVLAFHFDSQDRGDKCGGARPRV